MNTAEPNPAPTDRQRRHIDAILDEFDFGAVHRHMTVVGWKWGIGQDAKVPTVGELRRMARLLLTSAVTKNLSHTSSGGFEVWRRDDLLWLGFAIASWDNEGELEAEESEHGEGN